MYHLKKNTIIVFASDNGGLIGKKQAFTNNYPLRAGKGHIYEGGVRVPNIIVAPGVTQGGTKLSTPMISMDYYPTLMELVGIDYPESVKNNLDGKSLVPALKGTGEPKRDAIFWHYPHYHLEGASPYSAILKNGWKLIYTYEDQQYQLFNLKEDIGETINLVDKFPQKKEELQRDLEAWKVEVGAQLPTENLNYDPLKNNKKKSKK